MSKYGSKTVFRGLIAAGLLAAALAAPATATPADEAGEHKVTICHVTNSPTNPYVIITVDVAAFDGEGKNDHSHHESKDGRRDFVLVGDSCEDGPTDGENPDED